MPSLPVFECDLCGAQNPDSRTFHAQGLHICFECFDHQQAQGFSSMDEKEGVILGAPTLLRMLEHYDDLTIQITKKQLIIKEEVKKQWATQKQ